MAAPATPTGTSTPTTPQPPAGGTPPAAAAPAAQPPAAAPAAPPAAAPAAQSDPKPKGEAADPEWLGKRLDRERKSLLKKLGWEGSDEDAKAAFDELKTRRDAEKTELQKAQDEAKALSGVKGELDAMTAVITERAKVELAALTAEQRTAIDAIAGDDASAQLRAIDAFKPTWAAPSTPAAPGGSGEGDGTAPAAPLQGAAPVPAPASSMPTGGAPAGAPPTGEENHLAVYQELDKTNPLRAARYYVAHQESIVRAQRAST